MKKVSLNTLTRILEEKVRPSLLNHGGEIELIGITDENEVHVRFLGACSGCPSAHITLETVVKGILLSECPEIKDVVADVSISKDLLETAKKFLSIS